jgi:hypothetical protein
MPSTTTKLVYYSILLFRLFQVLALLRRAMSEETITPENTVDLIGSQPEKPSTSNTHLPTTPCVSSYVAESQAARRTRNTQSAIDYSTSVIREHTYILTVYTLSSYVTHRLTANALDLLLLRIHSLPLC